MPECQDCGAHVSTDFVRVFGDETGTVRSCYACRPKCDIAVGAAVDPERTAEILTNDRNPASRIRGPTPAGYDPEQAVDGGNR